MLVAQIGVLTLRFYILVGKLDLFSFLSTTNRCKREQWWDNFSRLFFNFHLKNFEIHNCKCFNDRYEFRGISFRIFANDNSSDGKCNCLTGVQLEFFSNHLHQNCLVLFMHFHCISNFGWSIFFQMLLPAKETVRKIIAKLYTLFWLNKWKSSKENMHAWTSWKISYVITWKLINLIIN